MARAMLRRAPSPDPGTGPAAASTSARVIAPSGPVPATVARSTPRSRARTRTAGAAAGARRCADARWGSGHGGRLGRGEIADDGALVGLCRGAIIDVGQRGADLQNAADRGMAPDHDTGPGARHLDHRLVGLDREQRLVGDHPIALGGEPFDDLRLLQALAEIGQGKGSHCHRINSRPAATMRSAEGM